MTDIQTATALPALTELVDRLCRQYYLDAFDGGLSPAQWSALRFFSAAAGPERSAAALARHQGISRVTANQTVRVLEQKSMLTRCRNEADRRQLAITITDLGIATLQADPIHRLGASLAGLSGAEQRALAAGVDLVLAGLREPAKRPAAGGVAEPAPLYAAE